MTMLHGESKKALFKKIGRYEVFAEVPTRFKGLFAGGISREKTGSDTHLTIGGIRILISEC